MSSICISNCVNDTRLIPVRATYINLYKWPESDAEFVKTVADSHTNMRRVGLGHLHPHPRPRVADSVSCRQLYLRSYTFSRKETVPEKTKKCLGRVKERVARGTRRRRKRKGVEARGRRCVVVVRRLKELSAAAFCGVFRRLLSCSASVDVVDQNHRG